MRRITLRRPALGMIAVLAVALLVAACGSGNAQASSNPVQIPIALSEFKIESPQTTFTTGTLYRFVIKNEGTIPHDWAIMPRGQTDESQALIRVDEAELSPGASVTREFTFNEAGDFEFACHLPGHYEAGMLLAIKVE